MSRILVDQIRSNSASADAMTLDGSGNVTFPANATCSGTATGFGGGKILQVKYQFHNSSVTNTTDTYADSGLTLNITTASSGHAGVLVILNPQLLASANNGGDAYAKFNIMRDTTQKRQGFVGKFAGNLSGHTHVGYWQPAMNFYDTSTSASTTYTYKMQFAKKSDATSAIYNDGTAYGSTFILMEIGS